MRCLFSIFFIVFATGCGTQKQERFSAAIDADSVKKVVNSAIKWQISHMTKEGRGIWNNEYNGWADGVFMSAVADWTQYDNSHEFRQWYEGVAKQLFYEPGPRTINPANDVAVSLAYATIWRNSDEKERFPLNEIDYWNVDMIMRLYGGWTPLIPTIERLDYQMKYYPQTNDSLRFENPYNQERWCWCDALYMAPPTYAAFAGITGNREYLDFMEREFWYTVNVLYDRQERLFYRDARYFTQREKNGEKVFWGRGNGWVAAGIARVVDLLPHDYPTLDKYVALFQEMMSRIATLQDENGYWHASLLDMQTYISPETSATGFFTYALWWGINRGYLSHEKYIPHARKAWEAMVAAVHPDGKLGYVQPIGDSPNNITCDKNEVYGTAAFALAGLEVARYADNHNNGN